MYNKKLKQLGLILSYLSLSSETIYGFDNLHVLGNPDFSDRMIESYGELPEDIQQYFQDIGCNIVLVEGSTGADNAYVSYGFTLPGSILGCAIEEDGNPYNYSVYVESSIQDGYSERYPESSKGLTEEEFNYKVSISTLYHELGHIFDWQANYSQSEEFINIYNEEKENFKSTSEYTINNMNVETNIGTASEYFATIFACYFNYPDELNTCCPKTYYYLDNCIANIYNNDINYDNQLIYSID